MSSSIGSRIRNIRGGESRALFADKLGIGTATLQRYENDERSPDIDFLSKLQTITGYSFDYLIYGEEASLPTDEALILEKYRQANPVLRNRILMLLLGGDSEATKTVVKNNKNSVKGQQIGDNNQQHNHFASQQNSSINIENQHGGSIVGIKNK
ncbi:hypothetical protein F900_01121 [Acinetobacter modestus]|uniref:HTH cro/C1-type domain-containing protein n=1 Tax=Acinetobacter modestus TaxID=1776740 RepID=N9NL06_9GAMM|nr:helix-turn-helix transcriptional regulator [Acinetobacter modestus]ENX02675.1 hypothetical protein F900_01121 [Acinetobacter modestus]